MTKDPDDQEPDAKENLAEVLKTIEQRLVQYASVPEEVKQLKRLQEQLRDAIRQKDEQETTRQKLKDEQEAARQNAIYRLLKEAIALLFPENAKHK